MKYEVVRNNKVLSKHKTKEIAVRAMNKAMKKESELLSKQNSTYNFIGWSDKTVYSTGMYHVRTA